MLERVKRLLDRRVRIGPVNLVEVDVIRPQSLQALLDLGEQVMSRGTDLVRPIAYFHRRLRRDDILYSLPFDRLTDEIF